MPTSGFLSNRYSIDRCSIELRTAPGQRRRAALSVWLLYGVIALVFGARAPVAGRAANLDQAAAEKEGSRSVDQTAQRPDATPHRPAVQIAGRVVDEAGRAAPRATIEAYSYQHQPRAVADDAGAFTLELGQDPPRQINVIATAADGRQAYYYLRDPHSSSPPIELTLRPPREIEVHVVDANGDAVQRAAVSAVLYWDHPVAKATSDALGRALLRVPADAPLAHLLAKKDQVGFDYVTFRRPNVPPPDFAQARAFLPPDAKGPFTLRLGGAHPVTVRVVDEQGRPLPDVEVGLARLSKPKKPRLNLSGIHGIETLTDGEGRALLAVVPNDVDEPLNYWARSAEMVRFDQPSADARGSEPGEITIIMTPRVRLTGRVTFAGGQPAPAADVTFSGAGYGRGVAPTEFAHTDAEGNFEFLATPDRCYLMIASLGSRVSAGTMRVVRRGEPVGGVNLTLQDATRLCGRIAVGPRSRPLAQSWVVLYQDSDVAHEGLPEADQLARPPGASGKAEPRLLRQTFTDDDGNYEFLLGPGHYELIAPARADSPKFLITDQREMEVDVHSSRPDRQKLVGRVVLQENRAIRVARAQVRGQPFDPPFFLSIDAICDKVGRFEDERGPTKMLLYARSDDGQLAGMLSIDADDEVCEIPVSRACTAHGRLFDVSGERQLSRRNIEYGVRVKIADGTWHRSLGGTTTTDERGDFHLVGLIPGQDYEVSTVEQAADGRTIGWQRFATIRAADGGDIDLGDVAAPE